MIRVIITLLALLFLASCEVNSGNTPTDPNQTFTLPNYKPATPDASHTIRLTGRDSNGVNYTGSIFIASRAQTILNGESVIPKEFIINFSGGRTSVTLAGTRYEDTNGNLKSYTIQTTGLTCAPVSPEIMPSTVKIGDFGILPTMECSDNTSQERNWRVEDARNGNINIISNVTAKNQSNTIVSVTDIIIKINASSNIVSCKIVSSQPAINYKITLEVDVSHSNGLQTESISSAVL